MFSFEPNVWPEFSFYEPYISLLEMPKADPPTGVVLLFKIRGVPWTILELIGALENGPNIAF